MFKTASLVVALLVEGTQTVQLSRHNAEKIQIQMNELRMPEVEETKPEYFSQMTLRGWDNLSHEQRLEHYQRAEYAVNELVDKKEVLKKSHHETKKNLEHSKETLRHVNKQVGELES